MSAPPVPYMRHQCHGCGHASAATDFRVCPGCGGPLSLESLARPPRAIFEQRPESLWHYRELLPIPEGVAPVTLGEGATPAIEADRLRARFGLNRLLLKNETGNPTGSFKDRQVSVGITHARHIGASTVVAMSSGNVACSASAYAARAGMRAIVLVHGHAAPAKLRQAAAYGGQVVRVPTDSSREVIDLCIRASEEFGWYHLTTAGMHERYNVEGAKTIAYELYQQTGGDLPEWVVVPVGGGGLLGAVWRGFEDLVRLGLIDRCPRLCGVQPRECAPLAQAIDRGWGFRESLAHPWPAPKTIAGGLADDILFDGHTALPAIRETNGLAITVSEGEILEGMRLLAATEGILCEPSSAVVVAALAKLPPESNGVCCVITGSGIKDLDAFAGSAAGPYPAATTLDEFRALTGGAG